nr:response regulator transcription factor [Kibdelosporangium sp. MJ126-NF4]CEL12803.1 transcriptional regulator, LuxR family [Kibdelosporangium sp. MJ126-NF4]CTQ98489.1 transcriptional regulator, LuxR family [Kibdelosporangium sp. MJ126-NF4]
MTTRVPVYAHAADLLTLAGLEGHLRFQPELRLVTRDELDEQVVGIVAAEAVDDATTGLLNDIHGRGCERIVLVIGAVDDAGLLAAVEAGVRGFIGRAEATPARLAELAAKVASGEATLPPDLLTRLLKQVSHLQRGVAAARRVPLTGLSSREVKVLRLVADGLDTDEIARDLSYSSRTVKNILYAVTNRYDLRNRSHAVAYALRHDLI